MGRREFRAFRVNNDFQSRLDQLAFWFNRSVKHRQFTPAQSDADVLKDGSGRPVQVAEYHRCNDKIRADPAALTDYELSVIKSFGGTEQAKRAAAAQELARRPPTEAVRPTPVAPPAVSSTPLNQISRQFRKDLRASAPFDRVAYSERVRAKRAEYVIVPGQYHAHAVTVALAQLHFDPAGLTDGDISELAIVDPDLGERARAARSGKDVDSDEEFSKIDDTPASLGMLLAWTTLLTERLEPWIGTIQRLARETHVRVDALEKRLADSNFEQLSAEHTIKSLRLRVEELEARPSIEYCGVFTEGRTYSKGSAVTWSGSLWIASETTTMKPAFGAGPQHWKLAVKQGRDGKDLR